MELTLEERERIAYIEGRTEEAKLLALAMDGSEEAVAEAAHEARGQGFDDGYEAGYAKGFEEGSE